MAEEVLFSIVIPTYNRETLIAKAIQSTLSQDYRNFEAIIVDDGSTDNTENVVKSINDDRIHYYKKANEERAAARNFGVQKSKGAYITFLDSDDLLYPSYLSSAIEAIQKYNNPPFIHVAYEVKDAEGNVLSKKDFIKSFSHKFLVYGNPLSCLGEFIRADVFEAFRFNEDRNLTMAEDWELWIRLIANFGIVTSNKISAAMIYHENRSLKEAEAQKLVMAKELAIRYAFEDEKVAQVYGKHKTEMNAFSESYIALHLAASGNKKLALKYLLRCSTRFPMIIFTKRFFVIVKRLLM